MAICTYMGYTNITTNNWDIRPSVTIKALLVSYTSPPVWKQCPCGETTSEPYKPAFYNGCYDSRLKVLSQEATLVLEWHKRTQ